jgi:fatty-acyl-CoA synthase
VTRSREPGRGARGANLCDVLRLGAARWPDHECVVYRERRHSYADFATVSGGQAAELSDAGIARGDAVVVLAENSDLLLATFLAIAAIGALNVPLNTMSILDEAIDVVGRTNAAAVLYGSEFADLAEQLRVRCPSVRLWQQLDATTDSVTWRRAPLPEPVSGGDEPAMVIFTSGSTGRPKGCVKSHGNLVAHMLHAQLGMPRTADDRDLYVIPLAGIGLANFALLNLLVGAALVLDRFDPAETLRLLATERITTVFLPPTMLHAMLVVPGQAEHDLSRLRRIDTGYEMSARLRGEIATRFGPIVHYGYGSSEGTLSYAPADRFMAEPQCVGVVFGLDELAVVDSVGRRVPVGEVGEIIARGPSVLCEYLGDPALTRATIRDGWYHSGDLGRMGPDGMLYFAGRLKDMIKTGGLNVAAAEVEQAIALNVGVEEVAVLGVPDDKWGEAVVAAVVAVPGAGLTAGDLQQHARERLAGYKRPKHFVLLDRLPINAAGKVSKGVLRVLVEQRIGGRADALDGAGVPSPRVSTN